MGGPFDEIQLPSSKEIECKVLASAVYAPDWYDGLGVRREDFFFEAHRRLHDAVENLRVRGKRSDLNFPNVRLELDRIRRDLELNLNAWQRLDGALNDVINTTGKPTELEVNYLRELSLCRKVASAMGSVAGAVSTGDIRKVRESLDAACDAADAEDLGETFTMHDLAKMAYRDYANRDRESQGADLGLTHLRGHMGPVGPGFLVTVGARPNVGKSGLALAMAEGALPYGTRCGYISLEDQPKIVGPRGLAMKSGVSPRAMYRGKVPEDQLPVMQRGYELWEGEHFYVEFPKAKDHVSVKQSIRRLARRGCTIVFIDYLGVIRYAGKGLDRREAVGVILSELKTVAEECGMAIVLFCQLRRRSDEAKKGKRFKGKEQKRPELDELKEAGDVEEKSDVVLLMWRDENQDDSVIHVEVAKGKWGGVGHTFDMKRGNDAVLREIETYEEWLEKQRQNQAPGSTGPTYF